MLRPRGRVIAGVDAGFANIGIAVIDATPRTIGVLHVEMLKVPIVEDAKWVLASDLARLYKQHEVLDRTLRAWRPECLAVEAYAPRQGMMGGNGWKTALGYSSNATTAWALGIAVEARWPGDLRRALCGTNKATKEEVEAAIGAIIGDKGRRFVEERVNRGDFEHVYDAIGHAIASARGYP